MIDDNNTAVEYDELKYYHSSDQELGYLTDQSSSSNNNYRDGTIRSSISEPQQQQNSTGWFGNTSVSRWLFGSSNNTTATKDYY